MDLILRKSVGELKLANRVNNGVLNKNIFFSYRTVSSQNERLTVGGAGAADAAGATGGATSLAGAGAARAGTASATYAAKSAGATGATDNAGAALPADAMGDFLSPNL